MMKGLEQMLKMFKKTPGTNVNNVFCFIGIYLQNCFIRIQNIESVGQCPCVSQNAMNDKSCQKPTIELAGRLGEKLKISP